VKSFKGMGIEFRLNTEIGTDVTIDQLLADYDAVFMGMGTYTYMKGGFAGEDLNGVYDALGFLDCQCQPCHAQGWEKDPSDYISVEGKKVVSWAVVTLRWTVTVPRFVKVQRKSLCLSS
jgi:glutamate synthase (NADPH/NADH) small chain